MYIPLHVHTATGSVGDSVLKIEDYVKTAKARGLPAIAITDHGSLSAMYEFMSCCIEEGIKPIIGMEAYVVDDADIKEQGEQRYHLVLLAKNDTGLENLLKIHNDAQLRGFYAKPRTDISTIERYHEGIIALSACIAGEIPQAILRGDRHIKQLIQRYQRIFTDGFYLEIQPGQFGKQQVVNEALIKLSDELDIPLVVTNDIHYLTAEDYLRHDYHIKLGFMKEGEEFDATLRYPDKCYWFMEESDILASFQDVCIPKELVMTALQNAWDIAESCNITTDISVSFPETGYKDESKALRSLIDEALIPYEDNLNYILRVERELSVIEKKGFSGYFLVLYDLVQWCNEQKILLGPGRGSAAGCLIAFLLGITKVDPLKYNLLFERFLDENRAAIPDVDIDVIPSRRKEVWDYLISKYGEENCAQISTLFYRKAKASLKDAARILGYPPELADEITKVMHETPKEENGEKMDDPSIDVYLNLLPPLRAFEEQYPDIFRVAKSIEGLPNSSSIHAAGIVISKKNLKNILPLRKGDDNILKTTLTLESAEQILVKFDLLALNTLEVLDRVQQETKTHFDWINHKYSVTAVWNLIDQGKTSQVFQMKSNLYRRNLRDLRPRSIQQLADVLALLRGPSVSANLHKIYEAILLGQIKPEKIHPIYDAATKDTCDIIIYQEQVMDICVGFGLTATEGYQIVKLGAKKKKEELKEYRDKFLEIGRSSATPDILNKIFDRIEASSLYSFNRSHALAYAMISYATAAYCVNFPGEYLSAYIDSKAKDPDSVKLAVKHLQERGFRILHPDINESGAETLKVDKRTYRLGFNVIKGVGGAIDHILELREKLGRFNSFEEFFSARTAVKCNLNVIKYLILARCFESLEPDFVKLFKTLADISTYEFDTKLVLHKVTYNLLKISVRKNCEMVTGADLEIGGKD